MSNGLSLNDFDINIITFRTNLIADHTRKETGEKERCQREKPKKLVGLQKIIELRMGRFLPYLAWG